MVQGKGQVSLTLYRYSVARAQFITLSPCSAMPLKKKIYQVSIGENLFLDSILLLYLSIMCQYNPVVTNLAFPSFDNHSSFRVLAILGFLHFLVAFRIYLKILFSKSLFLGCRNSMNLCVLTLYSVTLLYS